MRIKEHAPIDKTAALVTGNGPSLDINIHSDIVKKGIKYTLAPRDMKPVPSNIINRIGFKSGKLTVIGYYGNKPASGLKQSGLEHKWQVICECGRYEIRSSARFFRKNKRYVEMCQHCWDNSKLTDVLEVSQHTSPDNNYLQESE